MLIIGKFKDIKYLLENAVRDGYGGLSAVWAILLWLKRN